MQSVDQIRDRVRHIVASAPWHGPQTVVALALCLGVLVFLWLGNREHAKQWVPLFGQTNLTEQERDQAIAALASSELTDYQIRSGQLFVPEQRRSGFLAAIRADGSMPLSFHDPTRAALEGGSLIESFAQRASRMNHAKEREAELILIREIEGVRDALVRIDQVQGRGLRATSLRSAMVGIATKQGQPLDREKVAMIQSILLGLCAGLDVEQLTIADLTAGTFYRGEASGPSAAGAREVATLERAWAGRVAKVLSFVPDAQVAVHVAAKTETQPRRSVQISVALPSSYLDQLANTRRGVRDAATLEQYARNKILAAIDPLFPTDAEDAHRVAVNFFDVPPAPVSPPATAWRLWTMASGCLLLGMGWYLWRMRGGNALVEEDVPLRVFGTEEEEVPTPQEDEETAGLRAKLRAYVEEDPEAAAKSLADFIDRAS